MRRVFFFIVITAILTIAGCKKDNEEGIVPEITLSSTEDIIVSYEGGTSAVAYEITNPVDGGKISAAASESWISNFNYDAANEVSFEVEANTVTEERSAIITLTYTYGDGKTVDAVANLVQDAYVESPDPVLNISESEITVKAEGGQSEISIEIVNPADNGEIKATAAANWVTVTSATTTAIVLDVDENTDTESRETTVTVTYTYGEGETIEETITVNQEGRVPDPELSLSTNEITVAADGDLAEISVEITDPADDGTISAESSVDWITVTSANTSVVNFTIDENPETSPREGTVTVTYTYGGGKEIEETITVNQEARVPDPELSIPQTAITVPADGGETEVAIEILNPAENGEVVAVSNASWMTIASTSTSSVTIKVDANVEPSTREGVVTVSYIYGDGTTIDAEFTVTQEAASQSQYDYEYEMVKIEGSYYISGYNSYMTLGSTNYSALGEANTAFYQLDMYSDGPNNNLPTPGTYNFSYSDYQSMTFARSYSKVIIYDENGIEVLRSQFSGGTVEVSYEGENMILEGFLTDANGKTHHITYNGPKPSL